MPFSDAQFLDLFGRFNTAWWPVLAALWLASAWVAAALVRDRARPAAVGAVAAVLWAWTGIVYHALYFRRINPAAWLFAAAFVAEAVGFAWWSLRPPGPAFNWARSGRHAAAAAFLIGGLAYPVLVVLGGHAFPRAPAYGVPCPVTLFTAGVLLAAERVPRALLVIPILWSLIGGSAALLLGMTPDLLLFAAAACLTWLAVTPVARRRSARR